MSLWAQPTNDECIDAIPLTELSSWCSVADAFTTINATVSAEASPQCFPNNTDAFDIWFSFTAIASEVSIDVTGAVAVNPGGTLQNPQFALYAGS
ncbi:MAG: hypothetical protein AAGJ93_12845, partial [Bacteroidota bacterium]